MISENLGVSPLSDMELDTRFQRLIGERDPEIDANHDKARPVWPGGDQQINREKPPSLLAHVHPILAKKGNYMICYDMLVCALFNKKICMADPRAQGLGNS